VATRINLDPNPALKTTVTGNGTDWTSTPSGYARQTGLTGMDRTTGFGGSGAIDPVTTPRFAAVAGQSYVASIQVKTGASNTFKMLMNWYSGTAAGSTFIGNSGTSVPFTVNGVSRCEIGPVTAPPGAGAGYLRIIELDSTTVSLTGLIVEQTSTPGLAYFDGDSPGCTWAGTSGNSISYQLTGSEAWSWASVGSVASVAPGPTGADAASWADSGAVGAGSGTIADYMAWTSGAMVVGLGYDARRGRVRINAFGLPATAIRVVVDSRRTGSFVFNPVRGGKVGVVNGTFAKQVDDYEFISGTDMDYRIRAYTSAEGTTDTVVAQAVVTTSQVLADVWVKYIASPSLNTKVTLIGWGDISRASRTALYDVKGRPDPIAVTDVHSSRRVEVQLRTSTVADGDALDHALSSGAPLFLHVPITVALPSLYAVAGDYSYSRPSLRSAVRHWNLPLTEVAAPPPSVTGSAVTCQTILDGYATCADVLAAFATCQDLAD
jgi:hypothetical protein